MDSGYGSSSAHASGHFFDNFTAVILPKREMGYVVINSTRFLSGCRVWRGFDPELITKQDGFRRLETRA